MKRFKGVLAVILCAAMLAGLPAMLGGCSFGTKTITVILPDWGNSVVKPVEDALNSRLKALGYKNFQVAIIWDAAFGERAKLAADTADTKVDIIMTNSWQKFKYDQYAAAGAFLRLDKPDKNWLANEGKGMYDLIPKFLWDDIKVNGPDGYGIYGAPCYKDYASWTNWDVNNTLLSELGFNFDEMNWDYNAVFDPQFEASLAAAKAKYPNMYPMIIEPMYAPFQMTNADFDYTQVGLFHFAHDPVNPALPERPMASFVYDVPEVQKLIAKFEEFYQKGYIDPRTTLKDEAGDARLGALNSANYLYNCGNGGGPADAAEVSAERGIDVREPYMTTRFVGAGCSKGAIFAISIYSKNYKEAIQFLNLMNTDEVIATTLAFGVEGVHFTRNADGTLTRTEKGLQEIGAWVRGIGNYMDLVPALDVNGPTFKEDFKAENSLAIPTAYVGFTFDPTPVETEIAALKNVYAEYNYRIASGAGNAALMDEYRKKLNDNSLQKVLDEVNRQLDEFYKKKNG